MCIRDRASIGAIFAQLTTDFTTLMKQEVALAKAEVTQSAKQAGKGAGFGAGAGVAAHPVSYTHLRAHETVLELVCPLLLEKKQLHID